MTPDTLPGPAEFRTARPPARPLRDALVLTVVYAVVGAAYILLSSQWAADSAATVEQLRRIETLKGIAFVGGTALGLFLLAWGALSSLRAREERILDQMAALTRSERAVTTGLFAASVAHDINNALLVADLELEELEEADLDTRRLELVRRTRTAFRQIRDLSSGLLILGRDRVEGEADIYQVAEVVESAVEVARPHRQLRKCAIRVTIDADLPPVWGNPTLLSRAMLNLLLNAGEAMEGEGRIEVEVRAESGQRVVIEVSDTGPGVDESRWEEIFEAYRTTKEGGTGLGLISVRLCAAEHGGTATVGRSPELGGARFTLSLLAAPRDFDGGSGGRPPGSSQGART